MGPASRPFLSAQSLRSIGQTGRSFGTLEKRTVHTRPNVRIVEIGDGISGQSTEFVRRIAHNDDRYARIEELFVSPAEYPSMLEKLEARRLLFIIGDPGIGKTYSAVRLLKHYFSLGYDPIWYAGLERAERIEQYGNRASALRFTHPYYEEAFVKAAEHDPVTQDALASAVKFAARTSLRTVINGIMNHVGKYPVLVLSLLQNLVPVMKSGATLSDMSYA